MAAPQTVIRGNNASTASYELAPGVFQYIQSVHVVIDNTAGADVRPVLEVKTQDGVVMSAKRQGETLPAGDTGSATWALRLDDESVSNAANVGWRFNVFNGDQSEGETQHGWGYVQSDDSTDHVIGELGLLFDDVTGNGAAILSRNPADTKRAYVEVSGAGGQIKLLTTDPTTGQVAVVTAFFRVDTDNASFRLLDSGEAFWEGTGISCGPFDSFAVDSDVHAHSILANGGTFIINDHLGSPLVTYTG